ncbi:cation:proton antiporter [Polluticoccus soli]|uniref:cation:proton antiporter domain-containing protein n=1 Tax=Polluticoccus soli TaxID=3034150 RepID=UPI0023E2E28C|nr:cation:proton antiporter [Flavipsychrobacter sp. JY13-12]
MAHPLPVFILQLIIIIIASRLCAFLFKKIGQPPVMGEIIAGIALGPSLFGALAPDISAFIFPPASLGNLQLLSQIGLILFMFVIGMELDLNIIKRKARSAVFISNASIILPFALGAGLSFFLHTSYAPAGISKLAFALFMGIAMSITAFPVLARVLKEKNLSQTKLGAVALTAAAINDVTGWCILAFVIALAKADGMATSFYTLGATIAYMAVMLLAVRPFLKKLSAQKSNDTLIKQSSLAIIFLILLGSAYACEVIGIHALFGAFMAGVVMPIEWNFRKLIIDKVEDVASIMFLPIFFVLTGLRTQINLLNDPALWSICLVIIALAIIGKFGGSYIAARIAGESKHDSLAIGALMNTRGLMELIILNIGYDLGILSPEIFTMMVIMALVTTFMTSPVLDLLKTRHDQ